MSYNRVSWLTLGGKLHLVYTRDTAENTDVIRWRSPLLMAEMDTNNLCLKKETETVVLPIRGDIKNPDTVGLMGNFHCTPLSENEGIVTVGEMRPRMEFSGDTLIAKVKSI